MRRFLFLLVFVQFLLVFCGGSLSAQFWTERAKNLKATFKQTQYDLGKVKPGTEYRFKIAYKNTGDAYLQIQEVVNNPADIPSHKLNFIVPETSVLPEDSGP